MRRVLGKWERALNQLTVAAELDALAIPMKQVYSDAIRCEGLRANVFAGKKTAKQGLDDAVAKGNEVLKEFAAQNKQ